MDTQNVFLVDDHQLVLDGLANILKDRPEFNICGMANNGQEALEEIKNSGQHIHLVLSDISMPIMNGTELCRHLKETYPTIKVMMLSMYNNVSMIREALNAEADGFILKQTGAEEVLLAMHRISDGGTYFSRDIIPILYGKYQAEKELDESVKITQREKEILQLIVQEFTSEEIAEKLFISKKTVDNHRQNLLSKTACRSTIGLVKFALKHHLQ